eukprot:TRINITY_DN68384_c0_g1_i1.p1 TRINITY_DN68384_c0_g1~~TRINITY_DN68384_c0_g1_i1.p1  ORF type:complete len:269 (-),score=32.03 TRINITY_DN68384_c0_g1_i1:110-916(-)
MRSNGVSLDLVWPVSWNYLGSGSRTANAAFVGVDEEGRSEYPGTFAIPHVHVGARPSRSLDEIVEATKQAAIRAQFNADQAQRAAQLSAVRAPSTREGLESTSRAVQGVLYAGRVSNEQSRVIAQLDDVASCDTMSKKKVEKALRLAEKSARMLSSPKRTGMEKEASVLLKESLADGRRCGEAGDETIDRLMADLQSKQDTLDEVVRSGQPPNGPGLFPAADSDTNMGLRIWNHGTTPEEELVNLEQEGFLHRPESHIETPSRPCSIQ